MNYINEQFDRLIQTEENRRIIEDMRRDVDSFLPNFSDSPETLSRWGHYYFCDQDGGRLIFDPALPHEHRCQVCGTVYKNQILDGVWTSFYRNRAVVLALVSAVVYRATKEKKYLDYTVKVISFYAENYEKFPLHNKENDHCVSYDTMAWGCGKMMPQGLNESIVAIRFVQAIELLRDELDEEWLLWVHEKMFREMFRLLAPQVNSIHNISCWDLSAIGVIGLAFHDEEMVDFAFHSEFNIREQLKKGVTQDSFWYEGSIHYNFFLLEGISYLFLFSKIYGYDFGKESTEIFENMFIQAYHYGFDNQYLPNPNDGWPNLNLKTFSYVYHTVARAFGEESPVGNITKIIETSKEPRTILPLSEPYYCNNKVCLEQLLFNIDFDYDKITEVKKSSRNFPRSNFVMLRNRNWNVFMKYGLNGRSHAHPDIMTVEVMYKNHRISRDLSNAGYQSRLCNEWHRKTLSHNTVCFNGEDITSVSPGECLYYDESRVTAAARNVYEGVDYERTLKITEKGLKDVFQVESLQEGIFDYVFHLESDMEVSCSLDRCEADLGFRKNGYQHILEVQKIKTKEKTVLLKAVSKSFTLEIETELGEGQELYLLKTMDNPVNRIRNTILIRSVSKNPEFHLRIKSV